VAIFNTICERLVAGGRGAAQEILHEKANKFKRLVVVRAGRNNNFISIHEQGVLEEEGVKEPYNLINEVAKSALREACIESAIILESEIKVFARKKLQECAKLGSIDAQDLDKIIGLLVYMHVKEEQAKKTCGDIISENGFTISNQVSSVNTRTSTPSDQKPKTVLLKKGSSINLRKSSPKASHFTVGLGWSADSKSGQPFDLDAIAFLLGAGDKVRSDSDFIFFNNLESSCGSVKHCGDSKDGVGDGDDEKIKVVKNQIPNNVEKIFFCVNINDAEDRKQNFGQVSEAYIRILDDATNHEIARYDLSEGASKETTMVFGALFRSGDDWEFKAIGREFGGGLTSLAKFYGVNV